jgi:hypothetical protein
MRRFELLSARLLGRAIACRLLPAVALAGILAGCGMGGADSSASAKAGTSSGSPASPALAISTASLPAGQPGVAYPTTSLTVANAVGAVTWAIDSGSLPAGLTFSDAGVLSGVPQTSGFATLTVRASSGTQTAARTFGLSVGIFGVVASSGLVEGRAWTGVPVTLTCSGATGSVRFEVVRADSAGAYASTNAAAGTAVWMPGDLGGAAREDHVRAVDTTTGASARVEFSVVADPTAGYTGAFGQSDVWHVDPTVKVGSHAYATDLQAVLVTAGLRQTSSTSRDGDACDRLAEAGVRIALLRHLNLFYARNADGTQGTGLPITFCYHAPVGYSRAAPGSWLTGRGDRYSVMAVAHGTRLNVVGTAFEDAADNSVHENDSPSTGAGELGVFPNQLVGMFNLTYNNHELTDRPITSADVPALEAVLYGWVASGSRAAAIAMAIDGLGRSIAAVAAHEIGHSLGLSHTSPSEPGSIMNSMGVVAPTAVYRFTDADMARLRARLPGTGRWTTSSSKFGPSPSDEVLAAAPAGGIRVCGEGEKCDLKLAPRTCPCCAHGRAPLAHTITR